MAKNYVEFTWHANERVFGRFATVTSYAQVQSILADKPLRNGVQKVLVSTLPYVVRIADPEARNGQYIEGRQIKAVVNVTNGNEVQVRTIVLE